MVGLDDYLRRFSGVIVRGSGPYANIRIQGINSFLLATDPLFVVDDVRVRRSFSDVYCMVNIKSVTVLKRAEAAGYGINGANGVIVIQTE